MDYVLRAESGHVNVSPYGFHMWAKHYYKCKQDFKSPDKFSPVPYFLLCRAIELEIKSIYLEHKDRSHVKDKYGHNLIKAYDKLEPKYKVLSEEEREILTKASEIYIGKGFEYFNPYHAGLGYTNFPDLDALDIVAGKLIINNGRLTTG